ncbi:hypothetical protein A0H76_2496 [Hepatospora eriocheir]|uniref:Uncharacterized protein n=1 Tax=Hepatospora eriocheir TaxID=1081669 RepID=A0A1X0QFK1_9MICR|nr:hypothetical protein A0H76_2496 [Hepatospora eriocheir]
MKIITKVIKEVLKQFCILFYVESTLIKVTVINISNIIKKDGETELFKMAYFLIFMIIIFCIVIGLFASNYCIRGIAIPITGNFLFTNYYFSFSC